MKTTKDFLIEVNYRKSLKQAIAAVGYEKVSKKVENFRKQTPYGLVKNKEEIEVALFNFSNTIFHNYNQISGCMYKEGYRPGTLMELLAFCTKFEKSGGIIALGSIYDERGEYAPCGRRDDELTCFYVGSHHPAIYLEDFIGVKLK